MIAWIIVFATIVKAVTAAKPSLRKRLGFSAKALS